MIDGRLIASSAYALLITGDHVPAAVSDERARVDERNAISLRPVNIVRTPGNVPAIVELTGEADVVIEIIERIRHAGFQDDDGVDLPAFQKLGKTLTSRNGVGEGKRETVAYIVVAVAALPCRIQTVLDVEMPIAGGFINRVGVGVARHDIEALPGVGFVGHLQAVIAGAERVSEFGGLAKELIRTEIRSVALLACEVIAATLVTGRRRRSIGLVDVEQAEKFYAALTDVPHLKRGPISDSSLDVEVPEFGVRSIEVILDGRNAARAVRAASDRLRQNGKYLCGRIHPI